MESETARRKQIRHSQLEDLRALARLLTQATVGVATLSEGVHQAVRSTLALPAGRGAAKTSGIPGLVYGSIRGITQLSGAGIDTALAALQLLTGSKAESSETESLRREALVAALNGVMGDRLLSDRNPLAIPMSLRYRNEALNWAALPPLPEASGKVLVLIHGLCMNDLDRHAQQQGRAVSHGRALAKQLAHTPLYLRYNSGRTVSDNGRELAQQLEQLLACWPVAIEEISVVAHSMGGLLIRSAVHVARQQGLQWPERLKKIAFLGTPHHGAPLERIGNRLDLLLGSTPFTRPFMALGHLRSAGITDLRYGNVLDRDSQGQGRFEPAAQQRPLTPLPEGVSCYAVAATTAAKRSALADRVTGDGLVPLDSALGHHDDPRQRLLFGPESQWIAYGTGHLELLTRTAVTRKLLHWLQPAPAVR